METTTETPTQSRQNLRQQSPPPSDQFSNILYCYEQVCSLVGLQKMLDFLGRFSNSGKNIGHLVVFTIVYGNEQHLLFTLQ